MISPRSSAERKSTFLVSNRSKQLVLGGPEAHGAHDLPQVVRREEVHLLGVKQVEADLQALDLVDGEPGGVADLLEVNVGVGVGLA